MPTFQPGSKHQAIIQVFNQSNVPIAGTLDLWVGTLSYSKSYSVESGKDTSSQVLIDAIMPATSGTFDVVIQLTYDGQKMTYKSDAPVVIPIMAPVLRSYTWVGYYPPGATNWLDITVYNPNTELMTNRYELAVGGLWVSTIAHSIEGKAVASYRMTFTQPTTPGLHSAFLRIYYGAYQVDYDLGKLNVPIPQPTVTVAWEPSPDIAVAMAATPGFRFNVGDRVVSPTLYPALTFTITEQNKLAMETFGYPEGERYFGLDQYGVVRGLLGYDLRYA